MKRRPLISLMFLALALAACEKDASTPKGSGDLTAADKELFKFLPTGSTAVFGGNYMKLQKFMESTLGKMTAGAIEKMGPGMPEWAACFTELKDLHLAGAANVAGKGLDLRMVFTGMKIEDVDACAKRAKFPTTIDSDNKFIAVTLPPPAGVQGYLVTSTGALFMRQQMEISVAPVIMPTSRADLEKDLADSAKASALTDTKIQALIAKADRTRTIWFAGTGKGTIAADKLGELIGGFDLDNGFSVDVSLQLTDPALLDKLEDGVKEIKKMSEQLPGNMKDAVNSLQFTRKGDHVRFVLKLDEKQLADLMQQASMFSGAK
jgi:hypothetical protein